MIGYQRPDGRVGIRNHVAVIYTVRCAEHVARKISEAVPGTQVFGYDSCYSDPYGCRVVSELAKHPNVASALFVSLGCECSPVQKWLEEVRASGREAELVTIQQTGGTEDAIRRGVEIARRLAAAAAEVPTREIGFEDIIIGVECGGSDATSGLAANPAVGHAVDMAIDAGAACIFSELPELLGTDAYLLQRAETEEVRAKVADGLRRAKELGNRLRVFAISTGNKASGLTTIEEKSLGALCKSGSRPLRDVIKSCQRPDGPGLYLLDKVGETDSNQLTVYEENDNEGFVALIASGAHIVIFTTGCGNVVGSVVSPVIKVCGNPRRTSAMPDDFDVDAGPVILGEATPEQIGEKVFRCIRETCEGRPTCAEKLGHEEFQIMRKYPRACEAAYTI